MRLYDIKTFGPLDNQLTSQSIVSWQITLNHPQINIMIIDLTHQTTYT